MKIGRERKQVKEKRGYGRRDFMCGFTCNIMSKTFTGII